MAPATAASKAEASISGQRVLLSRVDISRAAVIEPKTRRWYSRQRMCSTQLLVHLEATRQATQSSNTGTRKISRAVA
jgi:hypothetical protein